jgi:uncharacterized protein (TIGR02118 family)
MFKVIALYRRPEDAGTFDRHYFGVHLPLLHGIPGLEKIEVTRITGSPIGDAQYHLMCEMYYASEEAMNEANASARGKEAARDLLSFAPDLVTLITGEVHP